MLMPAMKYAYTHSVVVEVSGPMRHVLHHHYFLSGEGILDRVRYALVSGQLLVRPVSGKASRTVVYGVSWQQAPLGTPIRSGIHYRGFSLASNVLTVRMKLE